MLKQTKGMTPGHAAAQISSMVGWQKVDSSAVGRWRRQYASQLAAGPLAGGITESKRHRAKGGGRKIDEEFEAAVLGELIYSEIENIDGKEQAVVKANVVYGYSIIRRR